MDGEDPIARDQGNPYRRLDDRAVARAALREELRAARLELRLFERDTNYWDLDGADFCAALEALLREHRLSRVILILHDVSALERRAVRLPALAVRFAPRVQLRQTDKEVHSYSTGVAIVDRSVVLRRPHFDRGFAYLDRDETAIAAAEHLFDQLIENSHAAPPLNVTGL